MLSDAIYLRCISINIVKILKVHKTQYMYNEYSSTTPNYTEYDAIPWYQIHHRVYACASSEIAK